MSEIQCKCGRPTSGATLCDRCAKTLEVSIANVGAYHGDLETLRTKQTRYGGIATRGSVGKERPLGVDMRFVGYSDSRKRLGDQIPGVEGAGSEVDHDTRNTVVAWARTIMEEQMPVLGPYCRNACLHVSCADAFRRRYPRDTVQSMCAYLLRQLRYIASERWAEDLLDEMTDLERRLARLIDRPAERWYAGKCSEPIGEDEAECQAELYAHAEKGTMTCPKCEAEHNVTDRRDYLLREASEILVTATEAAGALLAWTDYDGSEDKLIDRIRKWEEREKLDARGHVQVLGRVRSLYRLGDIQDLLVRHAQAEQERRVKQPA